MRRQKKPTVQVDEVLDELITIGDQLEHSVEALRRLVQQLRSEVPPEHRSPIRLVDPPEEEPT